jgi:hypothetical protein
MAVAMMQPRDDGGGHVTETANQTINPHRQAKAADGAHSSNGDGAGKTAEDGIGFPELLIDILHHGLGEFTSINWKDDEGTFRSVVRSPGEAVKFARSLPRTDIWFGINPVRGVSCGRGKAEDVSRLAALPVDLDFKETGCKNPEVALQIITDLSEILGTAPMAATLTGHGYQPYWPVYLHNNQVEHNPGALLRRWGRLVVAVADRYKAKVDNVFDAPRVFRVPGTYNCKGLNGEGPILVITRRLDGKYLSGDEVDKILSGQRVFTEPEDTRRREPVSKPVDWKFGQTTCSYVRQIITGIPAEQPQAGRHQWMVSQCVRLASAARLGCISEPDFDRATERLHDRLVALRDQTCEEVPAYEVGAAMNYAVETVSCKTDVETRAELRDHQHDKKAHEAEKDPQPEFWGATTTLRRIRDFAHARRVGPWGLLGVCMARVTAVVPPTVQLPPLVGANATLNLFTNLVAQSGDFKGATQGAGEDALRLGPIYTTDVGSGEGINHMYAHYDKDKGTVMDRWSVMFSVPEIDTLTALANRNGTTLLSQFRKGFSGEALTFGYADKTKAIRIPKHGYRMSLVVGVQPGRGRALLEDADGGTPQRFIWLPTLDPGMPRIKPKEPGPIDLREIANGWPGCPDILATLNAAMNGQRIKPHIFGMPDWVAKLIDDNAVDKHHGERADSTLDGHLGLCRIKVAAALALLHNEWAVTDQYWELSGAVMDVSRQTRAGIEEHLAEQGDRANRARGRAEGIRSAVSEDARYDAKVAKASQSIKRILGKDQYKGTGAWNDVYRDARRDREYFEDGAEALVAVGQLIVQGDEESGRTMQLMEK